MFTGTGGETVGIISEVGVFAGVDCESRGVYAVWLPLHEFVSTFPYMC